MKCGAELPDGGRCRKPAGWGRDTNEGKCKDHVDSKNQTAKKEFLKYLENHVTTVQSAAQHVGKHESTIWKWRQQDEEFDKKVEEAKGQQKKKRVEKVKDSLFMRIIKGDASASETIFWLKNNTKWKTNPDTVVNVQQAQKQQNANLMQRARKVMKEREKEQ